MSVSEFMKEAKTQFIPVERLRLNPGNVRFEHLQKVMSEEEIEEALWAESDTEKLYYQIKLANGLNEEIIVKKISGSDEFLVMEGARRTVCLRRLQKEAHEGRLPVPQNHYDKVKCKVMSDDITEEQTDLYLAMTHVKSRKPWATFNRAKHVASLHDTHGLSYDKLAKYLAMGKVTVIRFVDSYRATAAYGEMYKEDLAWHRNFTYFDELFRRRALKSFREDPKNIKKFCEWLHQGKFKDHKGVRLLEKILPIPEALEKFERSNLIEALLIVEIKDPTFASPEFRQIKGTIETIRSFSRKELFRTAHDESRIMMLKTLKSEVTSLLKDLEELKRKGK